MVSRQLTKEQAKEEVKKLVDKYNRILQSGGINRYNEEDTKAEFIEPLFEALGWDVRNTENDDEVVREEKISKGRVDYSFRINGIPKFFLEAKALKEDLDNIKFVEQAINYSWHKGCTWAVLTDFEAIKIFNAEWRSANPLQAQFGQILPCQLFLEKFDTLWLLSRESFEKKLLDTEAEKWGKKIKKTPVDKQLLSDLTKFRDLLNKNILKNNSSKNLSGDELDEAVQRIIDRLIFIRTLEDKELEAPMLQSVIREDLNKRIYKKLNLIFRKIDDIYNSKLFTSHLCESLDIDDEILSKIINGLFNTSDNVVHYDFSAIDADVLGNIYEQYLGHLLKKTDKRAKLSEGIAHRKEQGIYYTPTYVVDYIVKNTVGELAKDKKFDLKNIKILDPACGSGSFLMKAFDYLVTLDKKKNGEVDQTKLDLIGTSATYGRKVEILKNNIFGVDLDPKAVEIAQLNLLLKAAEKKHRLPTLQENIRVGNSLIDDPAVAGDKAFKWEEWFKDIMNEGGFDVVIGNPPYVNIFNIKEPDRSYFQSNYTTATNKSDLYAFFIERVLTKLLKEDGILGFIISNTWTSIQSFENLRKMILENTIVEHIVPLELGVFSDATVVPIILVVKKTSDKKAILKNRIKILKFENNQFILDKEIPQKLFLESQSYIFSFSRTLGSQTIFEKLKKDCVLLGDIALFSLGIKSADNDKFVSLSKKDNDSKKVIKGRYIKRYNFEYHDEWIWYKPHEMMKRKGAGPRRREYFEVPKKIILQEISGDKIIATLDTEQYFALDTVNILYQVKQDFDIEYLLGLLNSKLINFWYGTQFKGIHVKLNELRQIPIKNISKVNQNKIKKSVEELLQLNKKLLEFKDKQTDQKAQLEKEIQKLYTEIDEEVYKLYGITEEEKKIIEDSLK